MDNNNNGKVLSLDIKQDIAKGTYSNLAIITHSKNLLALQDNISKYEAANGPIDLGEPKATFHIGGSGNGAKS